MKIEIVPYNEDWVNVFRQTKAELAWLLGQFNPRIEHIGSTAVPGLAAKPVVDVAVGINSASDLDATVAPMINNRYIYYEAFNTGMPERRLFVGLKDKRDHSKFLSTYKETDVIPHELISDHRLCHVHIWEFESKDWIRHVAFRDYLNSHPEVRGQYEALKRKLSIANWMNGMEYNEAKKSFIRAEESKAIAWYSRRRSGKKNG